MLSMLPHSFSNRVGPEEDIEGGGSSQENKSISLYQLKPGPGLGLPISSSTYCGKLEAYLILTKRPYSTKDAFPPSSPNGLVPYVVYKGKKMADSGEIIAMLEAEGPALDESLSESQVSAAKEATAIIEDQLYWSLLYSRFVAGWQYQRAAVDTALPFFIRPCMRNIIKNKQKRKAAEHGCTNDDDAYQNCEKLLNRLTEILGEKSFIVGGEPHVVDCTVWAHLVSMQHTISQNKLTSLIRGNDKLTAYIDRMSTALNLKIDKHFSSANRV